MNEIPTFFYELQSLKGSTIEEQLWIALFTRLLSFCYFKLVLNNSSQQV